MLKVRMTADGWVVQMVAESVDSKEFQLGVSMAVDSVVL